MKRIISILFFPVLVGQIFATTIELDFPKLSGDTAWIYSFSGSRVDSFNIALDTTGKANFVFPQKDYRGFAYFYIPQKGGGELILGENRVRITCPDEQFNSGMLQFPQSAENAFLRRIFQRRSYLLAQQEWLKAGEMYGGNKETKELKKDKKDKKNQSFETLFDALLKENEKSLKQLDDSIKTSPLYAARLMELTLFMQRLYGAVQKLDTAQQRILKHEMQYSLDIDALYHSGNLWTDVHSYYPGLFIGANGDSVQEAYATSISKTMIRLKEPVLTAFLSAAVSVCERSNRQKAQQILLRDFLMAYPTLPISDPKVQRMLGAYSLNKGSQAPKIVGLEKPLEQPAILIFFESDCDHCRHELEYIKEHYKEITSKGYRIVSIAADTKENNYRNAAAGFVWENSDRLCDFKAFDGENFKNYGIIGTPTIFVVDKNGVITGKYAKINEIEF